MCVSNEFSSVSLVACDVSSNLTHGLGASDGGVADAQSCVMSKNQVGVVSRGIGSAVTLKSCLANDNHRIGVGIREGGSAECSECEMERNQYGVCSLNSGSSVRLSDCSASYNGRYGVSSSDGGLVEVSLYLSSRLCPLLLPHMPHCACLLSRLLVQQIDGVCL